MKTLVPAQINPHCFFSLWVLGIRQLQLMLLKMALLLGIEIHVNVEFKGLIEPPDDQESESKTQTAALYRFHQANISGLL